VREARIGGGAYITAKKCDDTVQIAPRTHAPLASLNQMDVDNDEVDGTVLASDFVNSDERAFQHPDEARSSSSPHEHPTPVHVLVVERADVRRPGVGAADLTFDPADQLRLDELLACGSRPRDARGR
jgi:hypothetical protein